MKTFFTFSILISLFSFDVTLAQQWSSTGAGPFGTNEMFVVGNTIRTYSIVANYQSSDNGDTWTVDTMIGMGQYPDIYSIAKCGNKYFSGDEYGKLFESTDAINWTLNHTFASGPLPYILVDGNNIYVVGDGVGIYYSTDAGANWSTGNNGLSNTGNDISQIVKVGTDIFISTLDGVYKSTDNCATWVQKNNGLPALIQTNGIGYNGGAMFTSGYGVGVFRSTDLGESWTQVTNGFNGFLYVGGFYTYGNLTVVGGSTSTAHYSTDNGLSWIKINTGAATGFDVFKDFEVFNGILFAATSNWCLKVALSDLGIGTTISENTVSKNKFSVYPNPSISAVTVDFGSSTVTTHVVAIYNSFGELVKHLKLTSNKSIISISDFPSGNYFFTSSEGIVKVVR